MITVHKLTMKNFMSVGNVTQEIILDENGLTLILGENLDLGAAGSRNGVGKTTMIQGISFAIFGIPLTNIKKDNLINKTNQKQMEVSLDYTIDNKRYRIERGRKPNYLRYYVNDDMVNFADTDEAHGESKITQREIETQFPMSHMLFKHIVALHTKTTPFLSESANKQRELIEELISITALSAKADKLKELIKEVKDEIAAEQVRIKTIQESNDKVQKTIDDLNFRSRLWDREHEKKIATLAAKIEAMMDVDIEEEIEAHKHEQDRNEIAREWDILEKEVININREKNRFLAVEVRKRAQLEDALNEKCPTCAQSLTSGDHSHISDKLAEELQDAQDSIKQLDEVYAELEGPHKELAEALSLFGPRRALKYPNLETALNHKHELQKLEMELAREDQVENPYIEQIANLSMSALQEVSYEYINEMTKMKEHQDFLLKLLISKDSFIRKKIIDTNLSYLNFRLGHYLTKLALPHEVEFKSDLSVEILKLGKDFDFEQLSNGEQNRLILSLAWAFRDVWESMHHKLNILIIDELVDSGMDSVGTDNALSTLKEMCRINGKNVFLISHKDGLETRVDNVFIVQKENDFTTYINQ